MSLPFLFEDSDLSVLPTSDPGGNRPWLFAGATGYQMVVGAFTTVPGITAHSALTGLANDDHPQYYNQSRGDARYMPLRPTQVQLGGSTSSFPMLKRSGTQVQVKLADDSAFTELSVDTLKFGNAAGSPYIGKYSNFGVSIYNSSGSLGSMTSNDAILGSTGYLYFVGRGLVSSSANGVVHVQNYDLNDATADMVLAFGPATSSGNGVRLKRAMGTTVVNVRNGNDSADASMTMANLTLSGAHNLAPITKTSLLALTPNAATGGRWRVTNSTPANREAYPDGTNWRWASDDTVVV